MATVEETRRRELACALSIFPATLIVTIGPSRMGRGATLVIAVVLSGGSLMPGYLVGCVIADFFPGHGCFF